MSRAPADQPGASEFTLPPLVRRTLAGGFAFGAQLRHGRLLHPTGVVLHATLHPRGGRLSLPALGHRRQVVVRLSKGAGLPGAAPDVLGLALRVPDAGGPGRPFDLLLSSCRLGVGVRHLPLPATDWSTPYGSLVPYRAGGELRVLAALPADPGRRIPASIAALREAVAQRPLEFVLAEARLRGQWHPFARLELIAAGDDDRGLRFDPGNALPELHPVTVVNAVREAAYRGSRLGFPPGKGDKAER